LQDLTDEDTAVYILLFLSRAPDGQVQQSLVRSVWFDRLDLSIVRQLVYDDAGNILSDTRYAKWQPYNGVMFPAHIDINRPQDEYGVVMDVIDMKMNKAMTDEQFTLNRPEGSQLRELPAPKDAH
jgi:hypothetical protein